MIGGDAGLIELVQELNLPYFPIEVDKTQVKIIDRQRKGGDWGLELAVADTVEAAPCPE
jgi:hypothetical protein